MFSKCCEWCLKEKFLAAIIILIIILGPAYPGGSKINAQKLSLPIIGLPEHPLNGFTDAGPVPPEKVVTAVIAIPLRNVGLMSSMLKQVSEPNSPTYHRFLSDDQIKQLFLPEQQFTQVMSYLNSSGIKVIATGSDSIIVVQGTSAQMRKILGIEEKVFTNGTSSFYYGTGKPSISGIMVYSSNITSLLIKPSIVRQDTLKSYVSNSGNVTFALSGFSMKLLRYAYNTSGLIEKGYTGKGFNVGILDFYGSPTVTQDLKDFDRIFGIQSPPSFKIKPIGAYDPNLGVITGWDGEIALDVESANAMAPGANITLYVANGALPLVAPISFIDSDKANVSSVSQSFGIPEHFFNQLDAQFFLFNAYLVDQYYMLGSLKGITFLASSGDAGGSGYSAGPEGDLLYPSSSPYVTSVGGTTTYISNGTSGFSVKQTAWSNLPFVPFLVNVGGGGGGVSIMEPKPWYQASIPSPQTYPNGRLNPDVALQASVYPGSLITLAGSIQITGGTSEASPLLAGLLAVWSQYKNTKLGLINPTIYSIGEDTSVSNSAFTKITFGYIIPWVPSMDYNLATGWGAPNIGGIVSLRDFKQLSSLKVEVFVLNSTLGYQPEYTQGQKMLILANITNGKEIVRTGSFSASLETLSGYSQSIPLAYQPTLGLWAGSYTVGQEAGVTYVNVQGQSSNLQGYGFAETFTGYFGTFLLPFSALPWSTITGIRVLVNVTDLFDKPVATLSPDFSLYTYDIISNTYSLTNTMPLIHQSGLYLNVITGMLREGPATIVLGGGVFGYDPIMSGIDLQTTRIYPQVVSEPGVVAPGQSLFIVADPVAPLNIGRLPSLETGNSLFADIATSSNISVKLINPDGKLISQTNLRTSSCMEATSVCANGAIRLNGYLQVPKTAEPGLYTIILDASFNSSTLGTTVYGSYYGQVYVSSSQLRTDVALYPNQLFQGQNVQIRAKISYINGTKVTNGIFSAFIYPRSLESIYTFVNHQFYLVGSLVSLSYSPSLGEWVGNITLPSQYDISSVNAISSYSQQLAGPYDVFVTGQSFDGYPMNVSSSMQKRFFIMPYLYLSGKILTSLEQTSGIAFSNVKLSIPSATLSNDFFLNSNRIYGEQLTIFSSTINGTLYVDNATLNIIGSTGGSVVATNSKINLVSSKLDSLTLTNSFVSSKSSYIALISPEPAQGKFVSPFSNQNVTGSLGIRLSLSGESISNVTLSLDGREIASYSNPSSNITYTLDTTSLPDGLHTLTANILQRDGISSLSSVSFFTSNQHVNTIKQASSLQQQLLNTKNELSSRISSLQQHLNSTSSSLNNIITRDTVIVGVIAAAGLGTAIALAVRRRTV
jgi:subtilase family serine protease